MSQVENLINTVIRHIINAEKQRKNILDSIIYIDQIKRQLYSKRIEEIDLTKFQEIISKIGIEEDEIFLTLNNSLEKYGISSEDFNKTITKEEEINIIYKTFIQLKEMFQDYLRDDDTINKEIVEEFIDILTKITESLYEKELENVCNSDAYKEIKNEIISLNEIIDILNKNTTKSLSKDEQDKIYNYIINSDISNKIELCVELSSYWIEQVKAEQTIEDNRTNNPTPQTEEEFHELEEEMEKNREEQNSEILSQVSTEKSKTKEEWTEIINKTIEIISNSDLNEYEKTIISKYILSLLDKSIGEINEIDSLIEGLEGEILLEDGEEYVAMYIVKNTIQTGNVKWSDYEIKKEFLTQKDIEETKKFVKEYQEQYANLPYLNPKNDEDFVKSVNYFLSVDCNLESLGTYAKGKNNYLSKNGINEISFAAIVYISKIQEKLAELENLINKSEQSFVKKENVKQIIKEIETWNDRYNELKEKLAKITPKTTDSQDTIKDIAEIDFSKQNAIIFLRPTPSSKTLYETGLMKNGNSKNHEISEEGKKYLKKILKNLSNNTIELKTGYHNFTAKLRRKLPSGNAIDLTIGEKNVERASEPDSEARVIMIRLNVRQENKKKIGIGNNHGVILVISPFEVNFSNEKNSYAQMISIIDENKEAIEEIMDAFQNPNTPKEVLQQYIADSFGLLNELISDQPNTPLIDNENMQVSRGGRK